MGSGISGGACSAFCFFSASLRSRKYGCRRAWRALRQAGVHTQVCACMCQRYTHTLTLTLALRTYANINSITHIR